MMVKKFLFVMRTPPYHGINLQEKLDVILTTAAFDQKMALLFLDDGVFQLKKNQQPEKQALKETLCIFDAFEMYDINELFIEIESMQERGINQNDLSLFTNSIARKEVNALIKKFDIIVTV